MAAIRPRRRQSPLTVLAQSGLGLWRDQSMVCSRDSKPHHFTAVCEGKARHRRLQCSGTLQDLSSQPGTCTCCVAEQLIGCDSQKTRPRRAVHIFATAAHHPGSMHAAAVEQRLHRLVEHISEVGQLILPLSTIIFLCCVQVLFVWFLRIILRCFPSRGKFQIR